MGPEIAARMAVKVSESFDWNAKSNSIGRQYFDAIEAVFTCDSG
jgi:hypothetical protein